MHFCFKIAKKRCQGHQKHPRFLRCLSIEAGITTPASAIMTDQLPCASNAQLQADMDVPFDWTSCPATPSMISFLKTALVLDSPSTDVRAPDIVNDNEASPKSHFCTNVHYVCRGKARLRRRRPAKATVTVSNSTYLRRLYVPVSLLRLFGNITASQVAITMEGRRVGKSLRHMSLYDAFGCTWEVDLELKPPSASHRRLSASITNGWTTFCQRHNVRVHDKLVFCRDVINGRRIVRVVVDNYTNIL